MQQQLLKTPKDIAGGDFSEVEIGIGIGSNSGSANYKYRYNGQELQDELGLNWYTYRYRNYMPDIGRFFGVDPISEDYYNISTYQFAHNNPVWKIEIEGLEGAPTTNKDIQSNAGNNKAYNEWKQHNTSKYSLSEAFGAGSPWKWSNSARVVANNFATRGASKEAKEAVLKRNGPVAEDNDRGSDRGAYRHALWSALMTKEYGAETAKSIADSHEGATIDISNKNNLNNIVQADGIADELNNQIGRKYGEERNFATKKGLALTILDIFKTEGLYTIKQNKDGTFNVTKTNISEKDWKDLRNRIIELNDNGKDK